jgi:hypothetical protein
MRPRHQFGDSRFVDLVFDAHQASTPDEDPESMRDTHRRAADQRPDRA